MTTAALPVVLLLDEDEARRFEAERPAVRGIVSLAPGAAAALSEESRGLLLPDPVTDWGHYRITALARRAERAFEAAFDPECKLHHSTRHVAAYSMQGHVFRVGRVWEVLRGGGPWLIPEPGEWRRAETREEALVAYLDHLRRAFPAEIGRPPTNPLFRLLRGLVLRLVRKRGPWLITPRKKLIFGLDKAVRKLPEPLRIMALEVRGSGPRDWLALFTLLREGLSGTPAVSLPISAEPRAVDPSILSRALDSFEDPVLRLGFTPEQRANMQKEIGVCEQLYDEALKVIRALKPRCYVSRQDSGFQAVMADAAGGAGVPRTAVNYNSFPVSESAIAMHLMRLFFRVRMPETLSDSFVLWSPHLAATSRAVYSGKALAASSKLRLSIPSVESLERKPGPYRVLHASNFTEWGFFFPLIQETSNEFLADILALDRVCADLPEVELTIRSKVKRECSPDALRRFLPDPERVRLTGLKQPFTEALKEADLLIGFGSTTIEEGVVNRKPVLLWGPVRRYRQLPARTTLPTKDDRAAIYAVEREEDLGPMIQAILEAHAGRPLTDAEIAPHVWPEGQPGIPELAAAIAAGGKITDPEPAQQRDRRAA